MTTPDEEIDDRGFMRRSCFVIMPFGEKFDTSELVKAASEGRTTGSARVEIAPGAEVGVIDFNHIYDEIIVKAVEQAEKNVGLEIACLRSDKVDRAGFIHLEMLEHVVGDDIAIVDITTQNANVFYELGVRHSFRRSTTILIRRKGTQIPFNISGLRVFDYSDGILPTADGKIPLEESRKELARIIESSFLQKDNDSLVQNLLPNCNVVCETWPIMEQKWVGYELLDRKGARREFGSKTDRKHKKSVGFITGDILKIKDVDVWVNPENTKMQMARYHDGSISSNIRYFGADRTPAGHVERDAIAIELTRRKGAVPSVEPGVVLATGPGTLARDNNVKLLVHVAALQGEPGRGYQPIRDYPGCVDRVLAEVDRLNALAHQSTLPTGWRKREVPEGAELHGLGCKSVIFPLFGSRSAGQHPRSVAENLYRAAVAYLDLHPESEIEEVHFLAYTKQDQELCERALGLLQTWKRIAPMIQPADPA